MFVFGHDFDNDQNTQWAGEILRNSLIDDDSRANQLIREATRHAREAAGLKEREEFRFE